MGVGLYWGLMDGLAIYLILKERAGMAAGISNTTRVASEGVALATIDAVLTALVAHCLRLNDSASPSFSNYSTVAQHLVL